MQVPLNRLFFLCFFVGSMSPDWSFLSNHAKQSYQLQSLLRASIITIYVWTRSFIRENGANFSVGSVSLT